MDRVEFRIIIENHRYRISRKIRRIYIYIDSNFVSEIIIGERRKEIRGLITGHRASITRRIISVYRYTAVLFYIEGPDFCGFDVYIYIRHLFLSFNCARQLLMLHT